VWGKEGGQRSETGFALAERARQSGLPVGMREEVCKLSDQEITQLCLGPRGGGKLSQGSYPLIADPPLLGYSYNAKLSFKSGRETT
jgi:hypothetical protein